MENKKAPVDPNLVSYLERGLKMSHKERFLAANELFKIGKMMARAKIIHKTI